MRGIYVNICDNERKSSHNHVDKLFQILIITIAVTAKEKY